MKVDQDYTYQQALKDWLGAQQDVLRDLERQLNKLPEGSDATVLNAAILSAKAGVDSIKKAQRSISSQEWGQSISVRSSDQTRQVVYGQVRVGGVETFAILNQGESGQYFHQLHTFSTHEIKGFRKLYLDGREVTFASTLYPNHALWSNGAWANLVFCSCRNLGESDQSANSDLVAQSAALFPGKWTVNHKQLGCAGIYLIKLYDYEMFPNGDAEVSALLDGHAAIFDPRDDSTGYTNNGCLVIAEYLTNKDYGPGFDWSEIDTSADVGGLQWAADICDQDVAKAGGGTEKRYAINGAFRLSKSYGHKQALEDMYAAIGGYCSLIQSKWRFFPGCWRTPTVTLSESDLRSRMQVSAKPSKADIFNRVKGKYRGEATNWEWSDYPHIKNALYKSQDGEKLVFELDQPLVTSPSQCQRLAKIALEQNRQWITITAEFGPRAFQVRKGDNIKFSYERFGWTEKYFEVLDFSHIPQLNAPGGPVVHARLVLKETAAEIYDWNDGEETTVDIAPNTDLVALTRPDAPAGLLLESGSEQLDIRADGTIFSRIKVSWTATTDPAVIYGGRYEIQYKKSTSAAWLTAGYTDGANSEFYILDVKDGAAYDVRVRAMVYRSGLWAEQWGFIAVGKSEPPAIPMDLTALMTSRGVEISWSPVADLDLVGYEVRIGSSWATAERIAALSGTSFIWAAQTAGRYNVLLCSRDTSGNFSTPAAVEITVTGPGAPENFDAVVINNMVQLTWSAPTYFSFPISEYRIYRIVTGVEIEMGSVRATIKTIFETTSGTYSYRIKAVDIYGNVGAAANVTVNVAAPPLFALLADKLFSASESTGRVNAIVDGDYVVLPVNATETFAEHFDDNSWSTPQDQIDDGFPIYIQPSVASPGEVVFRHDFGELVGGCLVKLSYVGEWVSGSGTVEVTLSTSPDDSTWTDVVDASESYATGFRYGKAFFEVTGTDNTAVFKLSQVRLRLEVKRERIAKLVSCLASDASGTEVVFDETVLDVLEKDIQVTFNGSAARVTGYSISGNTISVFLYDLSGVRQNGTVNVSCDALLAQT